MLLKIIRNFRLIFLKMSNMKCNNHHITHNILKCQEKRKKWDIFRQFNWMMLRFTHIFCYLHTLDSLFNKYFPAFQFSNRTFSLFNLFVSTPPQNLDSKSEEKFSETKSIPILFYVNLLSLKTLYLLLQE